MNIRRTAALATALFLASTMAIAQDAPPTLEEMWAVIQCLDLGLLALDDSPHFLERRRRILRDGHR